MLKIVHDYGFFSCYNVILYYLIAFINRYHTLPKKLDTSETFCLYQYEKKDVMYDFFEPNIRIPTGRIQPIQNSESLWGFQFYNYKHLDYKNLTPLIQTYFTPARRIRRIQYHLLSSYHIRVDNCVAVYYRGTDKLVETALDTFDSYYQKLIEVISKQTNLQILIQTDSAPFLEFMKDKLSNLNATILVIKENKVSYTNLGIHNENSPSTNYTDMQYFLATILIMANCKHVLCCSNNVALVIMFYRYLYKNTVENSYQNLNLQWL
jgi:hypothetical protein